MFGDWDLGEMQDESYWLGTTLFFVMVLFGLAVMGNIFIAVISEVYLGQLPLVAERWDAEVSTPASVSHSPASSLASSPGGLGADHMDDAGQCCCHQK